MSILFEIFKKINFFNLFLEKMGNSPVQEKEQIFGQNLVMVGLENVT